MEMLIFSARVRGLSLYVYGSGMFQVVALLISFTLSTGSWENILLSVSVFCCHSVFQMSVESLVLLTCVRFEIGSVISPTGK